MAAMKVARRQIGRGHRPLLHRLRARHARESCASRAHRGYRPLLWYGCSGLQERMND